MYPRGQRAYHEAHENTPATLLVCPQTIQNIPRQTYHREMSRSLFAQLRLLRDHCSDKLHPVHSRETRKARLASMDTRCFFVLLIGTSQDSGNLL